ncbi:hypothetical protein N9Y88_00885 [Candidatus Pelagibacter bacterium]|jgi:hypothetical protein|nr:hypothetical protein [Candidatus Pelagibacter bacterium]
MFNVNNNEARLIVLQRIELCSDFLIKVRKLFGRYIFSNFITKFFLDSETIGKSYYDRMSEEFKTLENHINHKDKNFLSIGGGMGGLEVILNNNCEVNFFDFIERNFVSKKVVYGWSDNNSEAYNNLNLQTEFLVKNGLSMEKFKVFDFDKDSLPSKKFDVVISLYSLDYHYDFSQYAKYLKDNTHKESKIIFDTVRPDFFKNIFKDVVILSETTKRVHSSKRLLCKNFLN